MKWLAAFRPASLVRIVEIVTSSSTTGVCLATGCGQRQRARVTVTTFR